MDLLERRFLFYHFLVRKIIQKTEILSVVVAGFFPRLKYISTAAAAAAAESLQSCPTLCDPIGGSPPGSPVPGVLQARTLKWVAIAFSRGNKSSGKE